MINTSDLPMWGHTGGDSAGEQRAETTVPFAATPPSAPDDPRADHTSSEPGESAWLVFTRGLRAGGRVSLEHTRTELGRDRGCALVLDDATVSRHHAVIEYDSEGYAITDAGSLNGTYLNRHPIDARARLTDSDAIWIGRFRLTFHARRTDSG